MKKSQLAIVVFSISIISVIAALIFNNQRKVVVEQSSNSKEIVKKTENEENSIIRDRAILIDNPASYESISDLIKKEEFKDNVLYIDIWSLTCAPCIREFQQSIELKERYKDSLVQFIYLVDLIESESNIKRWKQLISKYGLYGYHLRMSSTFYNKINSVNGIKFVGKPHFILVNKNGEIVFPNAERPSSKEKIYAQIDQLL